MNGRNGVVRGGTKMSCSNMPAASISETDMRNPGNGGGAGRQISLSVDQAQARSLAQREAERPLHRRVLEQKPCDIGLFSDAAAQTDLVDMTRR